MSRIHRGSEPRTSHSVNGPQTLVEGAVDRKISDFTLITELGAASSNDIYSRQQHSTQTAAAANNNSNNSRRGRSSIASSSSSSLTTKSSSSNSGGAPMSLGADTSGTAITSWLPTTTNITTKDAYRIIDSGIDELSHWRQLFYVRP
jgi:hypothetical protein